MNQDMLTKHLIRIFLLMACLSLSGLESGQLYGQVVYSFTGIVNPLFNETEVGLGETYTALFLIDDSVADSDPGPNARYENAVLSSSIVFSSGFVSTVDFTGGDVGIDLEPNIGVFGITHPTESPHGFGFTAPSAVFNSAELPTEPGIPFAQDQSILFLLTEPSGALLSSGGTFEILSVPEPSTACFLSLGVLSIILRRRR